MHHASPGSPSELSARVGRRITALRVGRGLSLSALARASGLSKSTLSELERGRRAATLDSLFAITTALMAPLSDLLLDEGGDSPPRGVQETVHGAGVTADLLDRFTTATGVVEIFRIHIGRAEQRSEPHAVGVQEIVTVLSGTAVVGPPAAPILLRTNETAHYPADTVHSYSSEAGAMAVLTMLYPAPR